MNDIRTIFMLLVFAVFVLIVLITIAVIRKIMAKSQDNKVIGSKQNGVDKKSNAIKDYNVQSVFDFMDFEGIEDNMIVQKKGKKYLMVIECQGVNYDLMSEVEKTSVESGFIQFLNTLTNSIQIYIQTRTINLERSLVNYRDRVKSIEEDMNSKQIQYNQMIKSNEYTEKEINDKKLEIARIRNLYEYGKDIISNTESMSLNKNILRKKYYIVVSYFYSPIDADDDLLSKSEVKDIAFSELYTKCQSMIRALAATGVLGRVINSFELTDLLYNAYNRDESETFGVDKAYGAGYDQLYVQTQDILDKKMQAIKDEVERRAFSRAEDAVAYARSEKAKEVEKKEKSIEELIDELAKNLIKENEQYLGEEMTNKAVEKIELDKQRKEAKKNVGQEKKSTTRIKNKPRRV